MPRRACLLAGVLLLASYAIAQTVSPPFAPPPAKNEGDEGAVVESQSTRVHFNPDGTGFKEESAVVRIQSEAGVQAYGQLVFGYGSATETLEMEYVRVRKPGGQVVETPSGNTQDFAPEVLQAVPMYGDFRQKHVTVVGLRPGDVLEYKFTTKYVTAIAPGQFWFEFDFPRASTVNEGKLEIEVPKDREVKVKSPERKFTTSDNGAIRTYSWVVSNLKPMKMPTTEEEFETFLDNRPEEPDVQMTSFPDWASVAHWYAKLQGERAVPDDTVRQKALELTRGATSEREKVRRLYDYVAKEFRYVSLSFGVGRMQPHFAREVLAGGYGDCKDKHTLLQALLAAVGVRSYPVLINGERKLDDDVASPAQFDHVITTLKLGQEWIWLDTTAEVSPFGFLTQELRNKEALRISDDSLGGVLRTPAAPAVKNTMLYTLNGKVSATGTLEATIEITATGDSDVPLRAMYRSMSKADWERAAQAMSSLRTEKITDIKVGDLDDTTKPLHLTMHVRQENYFHVPSADQAFTPFYPLRFPRLRKKEKGSNLLEIGPAIESIQRVHLQLPENVTIRPPQEVTIARAYGEFSTTYKLGNGVFDAERRMAITAEEVPQERRAEVESLRSVASNVAAQTLLCSIRPATRAAEEAAEDLNGSADDLREAGVKALARSDYPLAAKLLQQVVAKDAKNQGAWDLLGRAYLGAGRDGDAIAALQKQAEIDPYHKTVYADLGRAQQRLGKTEDAIASYRTQLDHNALDRTTHQRLGLLLAALGRDAEAIKELELATSVPPYDPETQFQLALLYARNGKADQSRKLLTMLLGTPDLAPGGDVFAAALQDKANPDVVFSDAVKVLNNLSDEFESNAVDEDNTVSAMTFVALEWARIGCANLARGKVLEALRYLRASWLLSQSGVVGNRLGRVLLRAGQIQGAERIFAMAAAAGGPEQQQSRAELEKLLNSPPALQRSLAEGKTELAAMYVVKLSPKAHPENRAELILSFDGGDKPDRISYTTSDIESGLDQALIGAEFPVMFPDESSIKIVRQGMLNCGPSGCSFAFKPLQPLPAAAPQPAK